MFFFSVPIGFSAVVPAGGTTPPRAWFIWAAGARYQYYQCVGRHAAMHAPLVPAAAARRRAPLRAPPQHTGRGGERRHGYWLTSLVRCSTIIAVLLLLLLPQSSMRGHCQPVSRHFHSSATPARRRLASSGTATPQPQQRRRAKNARSTTTGCQPPEEPEEPLPVATCTVLLRSSGVSITGTDYRTHVGRSLQKYCISTYCTVLYCTVIHHTSYSNSYSHSFRAKTS